MFSLRPIKAAFLQQAIHFIMDPQWVLPSLVAPFAFAVVSLFIFKDTEGPVALYAVLGGGILGMWGNTLYTSGWSVSFDRMNGTLETLMMTPTPLTQVIAGRAIFNCLVGLANAFLVFVIAEFLLGSQMTIADPGKFFLALVLTLLSLSVVGLLFSGMFVFTRATTAIMQIVEFPIYIVSGAALPLIALPAILWPISYAIGPSWGVDALRTSAGLEGGSPLGWGFEADILIMISITAIYVVLALLIFNSLDKKARTAGSLGRW